MTIGYFFKQFKRNAVKTRQGSLYLLNENEMQGIPERIRDGAHSMTRSELRRVLVLALAGESFPQAVYSYTDKLSDGQGKASVALSKNGAVIIGCMQFEGENAAKLSAWALQCG